MKVVIAIDSFKGSLSSLQAGTAAATGIYRADQITFPIIMVFQTFFSVNTYTDKMTICIIGIVDPAF